MYRLLSPRPVRVVCLSETTDHILVAPVGYCINPSSQRCQTAVGSKSDRRDHRLDFRRGLCLIDMVLVHLVYANVQFGNFLGSVIQDYTRFAAGGFVLLSGLAMGTDLSAAIKPPHRPLAGPSVHPATSFLRVANSLSCRRRICLALCPLQRRHLDFGQEIKSIVLLRPAAICCRCTWC